MNAVTRRVPKGLAMGSGPPPSEKLRLVLTDACNYSCVFCHNEGSPHARLADANHLPMRDAVFYAVAAENAGVRSIKLTGGEPLTWRAEGRAIPDLIRALGEQLQPTTALSVTTNGELLSRFAEPLAQAGLRRVTVSAHTLNLNEFRREISASGSPNGALRGISAAVAAGIHVKSNVVVMPRTLGEIDALSERLFDSGVSTVRLYRVLWSPLLPQGRPRWRISDEDLVDMANRCSQAHLSQEAQRYALDFLSSTDPELPRSIRVFGSRGTIEIDRMPSLSGTRPSQEEGDYALRISPDGALHSSLYGETVDLRQYSTAYDTATAVRLIRGARSELSNE